MEKYQSFHFSPFNNRSILMPRIPRGEKFEYRKTNPHRELFPAIPETELAGKNPYFQRNTGLTKKSIQAGGRKREYAVYVPDGMTSKGAAVFLFPDNGMCAETVLEAEGFAALAEKYHTALVILESDGWNRDDIEREFDFAWQVVNLEFGQRLTVDICESYLYPIGLGAGAGIATAFALTYSATFPAFAAYGDCGVDKELLDTLRALPSDGLETLPKTAISIAGFLMDQNGGADDVLLYMKEILRAREEGLRNRFGRVYLEQPLKGQYFVNGQPIAQAWIGDEAGMAGIPKQELYEEMMKFVLCYSRWGSFGNNCLRPKRTREEIGVERVEKEIGGLPRYWDVYAPSCYRRGDGKEYPLVVAIHGMSCNSDYFERTSDWYRLAEERGFFVCFASAYPHNDGLTRFPVPHWALGTMGLPEKDELSYFKELLDDMEKRYPIDKKRVYAVGHSNGSHMAQKLAKEMPERFAAFGPTGAFDGWEPENVEELSGKLKRPVWFMMGEYDIASPTTEEGSIARATLEAYCRVNRVEPQYENWYDNGRYHTLVMYDEAHVPMVCYTVIRDCPHTYTAEMAQLTWDNFLCHFTREADGSIAYHG